MAKYYYEAGGSLQCVEMKASELDSFKKSNPHLDVKTSSQVSASSKADLVKRIATSEVHANRRAEYPDVRDQLDAIMKWAFSETEIGLPEELKSLAGKCMSVKAKYPLPE